jgi:hypothetical protein
MAKYRPLACGPVAVAKVNEAWGLNLKPGSAYFSASAQEHAEDRHPVEFAACVANIDRILQFPEWVERSPNQRDGFALIRRVNLGKDILLVALKIEPDEQGRYIVSSTYKVTLHDIENRVRKGYAKPV